MARHKASWNYLQGIFSIFNDQHKTTEDTMEPDLSSGQEIQAARTWL